MTLRTVIAWLLWSTATLGIAAPPPAAAEEIDGIDRAAVLEAAIGIYDDDAWAAYLQQVGDRMIAASQRPDLRLSFRLLDDPSINVFPVAPGAVYLTRGLVVYLDSEAELAAVLGHAIAHLTERHKVYRLSHDDLTLFSLGVVDRVHPRVIDFMPLLPSGMETILAAYSPGNDRRADELALRAMERTGYDLEALTAVASLLEELGKRPEPSRLPGWWTTHPGPDNRTRRIAKEVATFPQSRRAGEDGRERFLPYLDGLIFDWNLERPYMDDSKFFAPEVGFRIGLPGSWKTTHFGGRLISVSPEGDAVLQISSDPQSSNVAALRAFFKDPRFVAGRSWRRSVNNLSAVWATFDVRREERDLEGRIGFVMIEDQLYRLLGYGIERLWMRHFSAAQESFEGIRKIRKKTETGDEPESARIQLIEMEEELSISQLEEAYPFAVPKRTMRILNRLHEGRRTAIGEQFKFVVGGLDAPEPEETEEGEDGREGDVQEEDAHGETDSGGTEDATSDGETDSGGSEDATSDGETDSEGTEDTTADGESS